MAIAPLARNIGPDAFEPTGEALVETYYGGEADGRWLRKLDGQWYYAYTQVNPETTAIPSGAQRVSSDAAPARLRADLKKAWDRAQALNASQLASPNDSLRERLKVGPRAT